jgi:hypothetical protein
MMRVTAIAVLATLAACSDDVPDAPPTLEVISPARGTTADAETITVAGKVTDNGPVRVSVAGVDVTPAPDGSFQATIPVAPGITIVETLAIDSAGQTARDVRAVLAGPLAVSDGTQAAPIGARAGAATLQKVGDAIATTAEQIDYTAAVQPMNPIYDDPGCLGARVNVTSINLSNIDIALVPQTGALSTEVVIDNLVVRAHTTYRVACISGSTNITLRATKARIKGDLGVRVASGKLATSLPSATVAFEGFSFDVGGVPSQLESLFRNTVRSRVESALATMIRGNVPPIADQALAGMVAAPFTTSLLGKQLTFGVAPKTVAITPAELFVAVDTKVQVSGGEGGVFSTQPMPITAATMDQSRGLGVAIANDILNQMFAGLWAADAFDLQMSLDSIAILGALLDDDARSLGVALALPPTVTTDGADVTLSIGDLMITVRDEAGAEIQQIALSLRTTLAAGPSQSGRILLTVGSPQVFAQVLAQSEAVQRPLTDNQVEGLVSAVWGVIGTTADDALAKLPMPTIGGIQLGAPTVSRGDGYVLADIPLM